MILPRLYHAAPVEARLRIVEAGFDARKNYGALVPRDPHDAGHWPLSLRKQPRAVFAWATLEAATAWPDADWGPYKRYFDLWAIDGIDSEIVRVDDTLELAVAIEASGPIAAKLIRRDVDANARRRFWEVIKDDGQHEQAEAVLKHAKPPLPLQHVGETNVFGWPRPDDTQPLPQPQPS